MPYGIPVPMSEAGDPYAANSRRRHECVVRLYPGVYEIAYQVPLKAPGGALKQPLEWRVIRTPKTVYDPAMYSDAQMLQWGEEAMTNAQLKPGYTNIYEGVASNGMKFEARKDTHGVFMNLYPVK